MVANQGFRDPYAPYYRWKDRDGDGGAAGQGGHAYDGADDAGGAAGQGGHVYEVTIWYLV